MRAFFVLLQKEFLQIRRNSFLPRLIVVFPIMVMLILPMVMTMDVRHVRVAVVDMDRSTISRRLISHLGATTYFTPTGITSQYDEALRLLERGDADIILQIPREFEHAWMAGSPKKIQITANGVNATKGSHAMQYLTQSVARTLGEIRAEQNPAPIPELITVQNRFKPTLDYRHYMIPALIVMLFILNC